MIDFVLAGIIFVVATSTYTIVIYELIKTIRRLEDFIMVQKDIVSFNRISTKSVTKSNEDKKKEKEAQEFGYYMKVVNSGFADEKDEKRFGTSTVDQG